jgi:hypothetical protein
MSQSEKKSVRGGSGVQKKNKKKLKIEKHVLLAKRLQACRVSPECAPSQKIRRYFTTPPEWQNSACTLWR